MSFLNFRKHFFLKNEWNILTVKGFILMWRLKKIFKRRFSFLLKILVPSSENGAKIVVSRLVRGNYFGEISLLKLDDGHNRFAILFADFFLIYFFSKITTSYPLYLLAKIFDIKKSTTTSNVYNKYILIGITWVLEIAYLKSQITSEAARLVKSALFIRNLIRGLTRGHRSEPIFSLCTWRYHTSIFAGERRTCVQLDTPSCCAYPGETLFRWVKICIYESYWWKQKYHITFNMTVYFRVNEI